jgi:flagellar protein FlaG
MSIETNRPVSSGMVDVASNRVKPSPTGAKEAASQTKPIVSMRREDKSSAQPLSTVEQMVVPSQGTRPGEESKEATQTFSFPELIDEVERLNEATQSIQRSLEFSIDDDTAKTVITVRDRETEEVIRQIPSEELLNVSKKIREATGDLESVTGFLFSSSA